MTSNKARRAELAQDAEFMLQRSLLLAMLKVHPRRVAAIAEFETMIESHLATGPALKIDPELLLELRVRYDRLRELTDG